MKARQAEATPWKVITPLEPVWGGGLVHPEVLPDGSVLSLGFRGNDGELSFTADEDLTGATGLRLEALTHGDLIFGGPGRNVGRGCSPSRSSGWKRSCPVPGIGKKSS